jgi:phosphoglycolate phosphatase-like HAD superfamily hydrolase
MRTLLLFDIDGTLITTGGAGYRAMRRAVQDECGVERALEGVPVAGRTDSIILRDALFALDGRELDLPLRNRIQARYAGYLEEELHRSGGGPGVCPGVRSLLDALVPDDRFDLALLTGNFSQTAAIKLGYYGLWDYFPWGAFGEDAVQRNDLLPVAIERYTPRRGVTVDPAHVVIIGDTPHDVACAKAGGARAVCVTTGQFDRASLVQAGADVVFHELSDTSEVIDVLASWLPAHRP